MSSSTHQIFLQKEVSLPGMVMLGRYQYAASQSGLRPHVHRSAIEICFLERGEQTYRVGETLYRLRGNDQFFTLPGEIHDTAELPQERGILFWLILRLEPAKKFLGLSEKAAGQLKNELKRMPARHFRADPECSRMLGEMVALLENKKEQTPYRNLRVQALLLGYLTLTIAASHRGLRGSATPLIRRVLTYIEQNPQEPVHVLRLAEIARLSESRFKIRFRQEIGVPPAEFWLRKKIEKASELLKTRNVTEVAYALGFSSSQYFATVFKRYVRAAPSQFRPANPTRRASARRGRRGKEAGLPEPLPI